jgi:3-oxoacyl-[acyl-carrier-protein] synthase II
MTRRVVVTGIGVVAPNGIGRSAFWDALVAGKSGIGPRTRFENDSLPGNAAGEVSDAQLAGYSIRSDRMGRFSQLAVVAAGLGVQDAGLKNKTVAVCIGSAVQGNADIGEKAHTEFLKAGWRGLDREQGLELAAQAATSHVQSVLGLSGPSTTIASACCTGVDTIAWGADQIRYGGVTTALVGATEAPLSEFIFGLFAAGGFLSTWEGPAHEASRPYDHLRSGLVLSEGAAALVLEDLEIALARGAWPYAEVLGYASASESGYPRMKSERYSTALEHAITAAIARSRLHPTDIDYVCAHGNSTQFDDAAEAVAHRRAFGAHAYRMPVSSIKSMIGQPFAAGGVMQAAAAALAINHNIVPPTINFSVPDPACDLDYVPNKARVARVKRALFHSHSLGGSLSGSHSAMVIGALRT